MPKGESLYAKYPDHQVELVPGSKRVQVSFRGQVIADSASPLRVRESKHDEVIYFPREDVSFEHLERTDHASFCPFKGEASYWTLRVEADQSENAVWSYEDPFDEVAGLKDYLAFYADRVEWSDNFN
jgi:uncharacterized protein (DUF427 family)